MARVLAIAAAAGVAVAALACGAGKEAAGPSPGQASPPAASPTGARGLPSPAAHGSGIASRALSQALLAVGMRLEWMGAAGDGVMGSMEMETFLWLRGERLLAVAVMHGVGTGAPLAYGLALLVDQRVAG